jgi:hypothetical protein
MLSIYASINKRDGTIATWGSGEAVTSIPSGLSNVVDVAAGDDYSLALKSDGTVVAWGGNGEGQIPVPEGLNNVYKIAAGPSHSLAIRTRRPRVLAHPRDTTATVGQVAIFEVSATGGESLFYQWRREGVDISNATNAAFEIQEVTTNDAGRYSVVVFNSQGSTSSLEAELVVTESPAFAMHPLTQTIEPGRNVVLSASAYGSPPMVFQWYFNDAPVGAPIAGTNVAMLTITNAQPSQTGRYRVQVFNPFGSAMSDEALLSVVVFPPQIFQSPAPLSRVMGQSAVFSVAASGTPPFQHQWRFNGGTIPGATNATLILPAVGPGDAGRYSVAVMNSAGSATSDEAQLWVIEPPSLGLQLLAGYPLLSLRGMMNSNFLVEFSTASSGMNWLPLRAVSNLTVIPYQFLDGAGSTSPARFYRAIMQ